MKFQLDGHVLLWDIHSACGSGTCGQPFGWWVRCELAPTRRFGRHLLEQLNRLTGTMVGLASETATPYDYRMPAIGEIVDVGWPGEAERRLCFEYLETGLDDDPTTPGIFRLQAAGRGFTRVRRHFVADRRWYRSHHVNEFRRAGVDDLVVSNRVVPHLGVASVILLTRAWGDGPIGEAHRRLVHLFHSELGRLWDAVPVLHAGISDLPPRLRQTLACLSPVTPRSRSPPGWASAGTRCTTTSRLCIADSRLPAAANCWLGVPPVADLRPRFNRELG